MARVSVKFGRVNLATEAILPPHPQQTLFTCACVPVPAKTAPSQLHTEAVSGLLRESKMRRSVVLAALGESSPSRDGAQSSLGSYDVKTAIGGGFGPLLGKKPFKVPLGLSKSKNESDLGRRKRKQVDYKGMGGDLDDEDDEATVSDDEGGPGRPAKKAKKGKTISLEGMKGVDANGRSLKADNRKWEVFKPKKESIHKRFSIPVMRAKNGELVETRLSGAVLGTRQTIEVPPRPLHDPMGEHAIVLFDPTVDDREAEREKERIQKEQEEAEKKLDEEGSPAPPPTVDAHAPRGPHKSLADILGIRRKQTTDALPVKVPVVIDPKLAKVLRPHQVEGVKVSIIDHGTLLLPQC